MSKRQLPKVEAFHAPDGAEWDAPVSALEQWKNVKAAEEGDRSISIYEQIGERWDGSGMTANRVRGMLRSLGSGPVTVNINSPGGNFFEGTAIYNLLREHEGEINVNVVGLAASAASVIAMSADTLRVARAGFLMIHNSWGMAVGNRNDLREIADTFEAFDKSMAAVYAKRSGKDKDEIMSMMDKETFLAGEEAVEQGFADALLKSDEVAEAEEAPAAASMRRMEIALAKAGVPRSERRQLFRETFGTQDAAGQGMPGATQDAMPRAGTQLVPMLRDTLKLFQ